MKPASSCSRCQPVHARKTAAAAAPAQQTSSTPRGSRASVAIATSSAKYSGRAARFRLPATAAPAARSVVPCCASWLGSLVLFAQACAGHDRSVHWAWVRSAPLGCVLACQPRSAEPVPVSTRPADTRSVTRERQARKSRGGRSSPPIEWRPVSRAKPGGGIAPRSGCAGAVPCGATVTAPWHRSHRPQAWSAEPGSASAPSWHAALPWAASNKAGVSAPVTWAVPPGISIVATAMPRSGSRASISQMIQRRRGID